LASLWVHGTGGDWEKAFALDPGIVKKSRWSVAEYFVKDLHRTINAGALYAPRFNFDREEQKKFSDWMLENTLSFDKLSEYSFEFIFCCTGLGEVKLVKCTPLGCSIDLSDYDNW